MEWRSGVFIERLKGQCRQALRGQKCVRDEPGGKERKEERKRKREGGVGMEEEYWQGSVAWMK